MSQKFLTKTCLCANCGQPMNVGDAFGWVPRKRSTVGGKIGGSYTLAKVDTFKPAHDHDCLGALVIANACAQRLRDIDAGYEYALEHVGKDEAEAYRQAEIAKLG